MPQNVSSFDSSERQHDTSHWRHKNENDSAAEGIKSKINEYMGTEKGLPMYKDKPNYYPPSRRQTMTKGRKMLTLLLVLLLGMLWVTGIIPDPFHLPDLDSTKKPVPSRWTKTNPKLWAQRADAVKEVFATSWDGYEQYAWGFDEFHPLSKRGRNMVEGGMGWIIVDALDTAIMMNMTSRVARAREWIQTSLSYSADHDVNTFETTIRMLGGLLSAHYLSTNFPKLAPLTEDDLNQPGEDLYIEKATDLADRLLGAYATNSGIPTASINLNTSQGIPAGGDNGASSTAEAATLQLEMKYLSKLTGEPIYWQASEKIIKVIDDQHMTDGLLPIFIQPRTGSFSGNNIRLGSRGDSYYEYLIKQFLQTKGGEQVYLELWNEALAGIKKHLITYTKHSSLTVLAERQSGLNAPLTAKMDHLVCFMPGTIALGVTNGTTVADAKARLGSSWTKKHDEDLKLAEELIKTCWGMYKVTATGLSPEISYFHVDDPPRQWQGHTDAAWTPPVSGELSDSSSASWRQDYDIRGQDVHNLLRPETIESLYYMYQITQDPKYREWGWQMFEAFKQHTKVVDEVTGKVYAYASLDTVMDNPVKERKRRDNMESFWLAETLKYFYLLFSDDVGTELPGLQDVVINTEAHFLPRFTIEGSKVWKTGWSRSGRAKQGELYYPKATPVVHGEGHVQAANLGGR